MKHQDDYAPLGYINTFAVEMACYYTQLYLSDSNPMQVLDKFTINGLLEYSKIEMPIFHVDKETKKRCQIVKNSFKGWGFPTYEIMHQC